MRFALALQTLVGVTLLVGVGAGIEALLRTEPALRFPWGPLSPLRTAAVLLVLALLWVLVNAPVEGRTLLVLSKTRGITAADLLALPAVVLALALVLKVVLRRLA